MIWLGLMVPSPVPVTAVLTVKEGGGFGLDWLNDARIEQSPVTGPVVNVLPFNEPAQPTTVPMVNPAFGVIVNVAVPP